MLDNLKFIRPDHRKVWADTYPIRLCIFPFYVFILLPIFVEKNIGNLLIGSEFDDLRSTPEYMGIQHYYGIYDQHQDFDIVMNSWYEKRLPTLIQWSAVRNISGLIVERILVNRYLDLARNQRSCHSCHFENKDFVPCGKCSKCLGVLLFLLANKVDPQIMKFKKEDVENFKRQIDPTNLRLDNDEKNHSIYLINDKEELKKIDKLDFKPIEHVEKIHINDTTCNPNYLTDNYRNKIFSIIKNYTDGFCKLKDGQWIKIYESEIF
jgi:hypothetical protein